MVNNYRELRVYQNGLNAALEIFLLSKKFPPEEKFSLTDQIRRSSRSVCANLGEAWRKRRYRAAFIAKLNDAEGEANETRVWLEIATQCGYLSKETALELDTLYDHILSQLVLMIKDWQRWVVTSSYSDPPITHPSDPSRYSSEKR